MLMSCLKITQRSKGESANATHNLEHKWMILQIQHSKLDVTKIDTESAIFAHVMNELKQTNGFLRSINSHITLMIVSIWQIRLPIL